MPEENPCGGRAEPGLPFIWGCSPVCKVSPVILHGVVSPEIRCPGFRVLCSVFRSRVPRFRASALRVSGSGFPGTGFRDSGFRVPDSGFRVPGSGFRVSGSGFRVSGSECRVDLAGFCPGFCGERGRRESEMLSVGARKAAVAGRDASPADPAVRVLG